MVTLTDDAVKKFQEIYCKEFKKELSYQEAYERASKLINLMAIIYRPLLAEKENIRVRDSLEE